MFRSLFGKRNPTNDWMPYSGVPLTFDLDAGGLNGCRLGHGLEGLQQLGPDEGGDSFRNGEFMYFSLGLGVECQGGENAIATFHVVFRDADEPRFKPFRGSVFHKGEAVDIGALTAETCVHLLGPYYWFDRDSEESTAFYEFNDCEWQIEFDATGQLNRLVVTNRPLLADESQREAYGVTKAWPFNHR